MSAEYDMILRFLRNNLDDSGFEEFSNALDEAIAAAVLREREACAQKCEEYDGTWYAYRKGAQECAAAIRGQR